MTVAGHEGTPGGRLEPRGGVHRRSRDRRAMLQQLLELLATAAPRAGVAILRRTLEESVRRALRARQVALRDENPSAPALVRRRDLYQVSVPGSDRTRPMLLEAIPAGPAAFDDWEVQALEMAACLAALILEIERSRCTGRTSPVQMSRASGPGDGAAPLIGSTPVMCALREKIERVAATDFTILIEGESGTGKELVARQIHELSRRRAGPFVAINCAALVETLLEAELFGIEERTATGVRGRRGKFEHAEAGTLFLDEVSDLSLSAQAKLLRAIQDLAVERVGGQGAYRVDIRIIAATNRSLSSLVADGLFRSDLFYRLSGVEVRVPPLRARQADILELCRYFLERHRETRPLELAQEAADALLAYDWPGNVRELQRLVESVVALASGPRVGLDDLPASVRGDFESTLMPALAHDDTMRAWASRYARLVFQRCDQNKRRACRVLGITYHTLQSHLNYRSRGGALDAPVAPLGRRPSSRYAGSGLAADQRSEHGH